MMVIVLLGLVIKDIRIEPNLVHRWHAIATSNATICTIVFLCFWYLFRKWLNHIVNSFIFWGVPECDRRTKQKVSSRMKTVAFQYVITD
uniref:Uncharacterized protein n=1 Tax=Arundo donax TaxID=35708 RepID=A0A0A8ZQ41_ARUDO